MPEGRPRALGPRLLREVPILLLAFGLGVGAAKLLGAANLGVAFGIGQLCFAAAVLWLILRG